MEQKRQATAPPKRGEPARELSRPVDQQILHGKDRT